MKKLARGNRQVVVGVTSLTVFALFMVALFEKQALMTTFSPGDTIKAEFARDYKLQADKSKVKIAGTPVGVVSDVDQTDRGTVLVSLKLDDDVLEKLGTKPSAEIRPTTILGGEYYVGLTSGGAGTRFAGTTIPANRTRTPVELDQVLQALPSDARKGLQGTTGHLDKTLNHGGKDAVRNLLRDAPDTLSPAAPVFDAMRGSDPQHDLSSFVTNVNKVATVLNRRDGQLGNVVDSLSDTTRVLAKQSRPLASTVETLPPVLRTTRTGLTDLGTVLDRVPGSADAARPAVRELTPTLEKLDPVLANARPLVSDLNPLLQETQPLVNQLVPASRKGTSVLNDLRGPVLKRVNGPIAKTLMTRWRGKAPKYPNGGDGAKFYEELGYLVSNINNATKVYDQNGFLINFALGAGTSSVNGAPMGLDRLLDNLSSKMGPPHQQDKKADLTPLIDSLKAIAPQQFGSPSGAGQLAPKNRAPKQQERPERPGS